jgi:MFS family permease
MFPECFLKHAAPGCSASVVHATKFIQIVAIVIGMLVGGALLDVMGRRFGSRLAAAIMTIGSLMLTFSSFIPNPTAYLGFFIFAQAFYGLGVGGEYPSASSSAAERAQQDPVLRAYRGRQMCLTFSQQGMGNFVNCAVILILMVFFAQFGSEVDASASRAIIAIQFAAATAVALFMMGWRTFKLKESAVWSAEHKETGKLAEAEHLQGSAHMGMYRVVLRCFWPRLTATSVRCCCCCFRGAVRRAPADRSIPPQISHLLPPLKQPPPPTAHLARQRLCLLRQQAVHVDGKALLSLSTIFGLFFSSEQKRRAHPAPQNPKKKTNKQFIKILYPGATLFVRMQWTLLNSFISLLGYYTAAALIDRRWYGRRRMQEYGFLAMFVLFLICGAAYPTLLASQSGLYAFQALYFLSSFFNQFGPNCVTWLAAAEVFPTEVRATLQGTSAAMGKIGAIIADVCFGLVDSRTAFYLSAAFGLVGALLTWLFLPDTTGLPLDELDRFSKYLLAGAGEHYHGQAVAPRHLSVWERWVWKWHEHHDQELDALHKQVQEDAALAEAPGKDDEDWLAAVGHAPLSRVASSATTGREGSASVGNGAGVELAAEKKAAAL